MNIFSKMMRSIMLVGLVLVFVTGMSFAAGEGEEGAGAEDLGNVRIGYVEWDREPAHTFMIGEVMERIGFDVTVLSLANPAMWEAIATGDIDAHVSAWLPATHAAFWEEHSDVLVDLGPHFEGAGLGLVVPTYLEDINSIEDLVANAEMFDNTITGIDPGAGMMSQTDDAIANDTTGLGVFELTEGSDASMMGALSDAISREEPIVVTGWDPHIKFARFDLKILEDPDGIFGEEETINTIVREGLEEENPAAYRFFAETDWFAVHEPINEIMVLSADGMRSEEAAEQVVDEYFDMINAALPSDMQMQ